MIQKEKLHSEVELSYHIAMGILSKIKSYLVNENSSIELTLSPNYLTNRYYQAIARISKSPQYQIHCDKKNPYGYFANRPIIGDSTRISGGVFISVGKAEALVVDEKYKLLHAVLSSFSTKLKRFSSFSFQNELSILEDVFDLTEQSLEWSPTGVLELNKSMNLQPDSKVALDFYLDNRVGVARHKVIFAAYILEKLKERGLLSGMITLPSIMRNYDGDDEFLVYTLANGMIVTLDPNPLIYQASPQECYYA